MIIATFLFLIVFVAPVLGIAAGIAGDAKEKRDKKAAIYALINRWG